MKRTAGPGIRRTAEGASDGGKDGAAARKKTYKLRGKRVGPAGALKRRDGDGDGDEAASRFPFERNAFEFDGYATDVDELTEAFSPLVSDERIARLDAVVSQRSFNLMPILEGVYDIGNVLAVCRSTEALGIGSLGVVSDVGLVFKQSGRTSGGAVKWTHLEQWRSTAECVKEVKARGYRVLVTVFEGGHPLEHYDWSVPTAVILGNEREGVSEEAKALADGGVYVSMNGFTESLNVSVASSMIMHHAVQDRTRRLGSNGDLSEDERETLRALYLSRLVPNSSKQGYLRLLLERAAADRAKADGASDGGGETSIPVDLPGGVEEGEGLDPEADDEVHLLNMLEVSKIVKRPRKFKFGRPVKDGDREDRIFREVELVKTGERGSEEA